MEAKTTKKNFKAMLNEKYDTDHTGWNKQSGARKRPYGDWLYSADKEMFDILYNKYIETGEY